MTERNRSRRGRGKGEGEGGEGEGGGVVPCMCLAEEVGVDTVGDCHAAEALYSSIRSPITPSLSGVCNEPIGT